MIDVDSFLIKESWDHYTQEEHHLWKYLYERQLTIFERCVCDEHIEGMKQLNINPNHIPKFSELSTILKNATGWDVAPVPGLVPDDIFFKLLSERRFPSTCFLRDPDHIDYLQEPDIFHDVFGHLPLLIQPVFADYMEYFGKKALEAYHRGELARASRLYWYTTEFGLIKTPKGLRTYGAGIVSSFKETQYCVEDPTPIRLPFNLERVFQTTYRIDDLQENYFVIESYDELFEATQQNHNALFDKLKNKEDIPYGTLLEGEENIHHNRLL